MPTKRGKRWCAVVYDPALKGKRHLSTHDTKRQAKDAEEQWRQTRKTRLAGEETCDTFANRWTTDYPRPKVTTNEHNRERVQQFAKDFAGIRLSAVDRPAARAWAVKHPGAVPAVRAMFTDAVDDGLCHLNPFLGLRLPGSRGRKNLTALTEDELHTLAGMAEGLFGDFGREYAAMVLFAGFTGLRPGELYALLRESVSGEFAQVERRYDSKGRLDLPKNGLARTVAIPKPALDALAAVQTYPNGHLFCSPTGRPWSQSSNWRYWDRLRLRFGRPDLDFYALRHTAATVMLERSLSPWDVAIQLGHQDGGRLVMELYGHPSHAAARARVLSAFGSSTAALRPISGARREQKAS